MFSDSEEEDALLNEAYAVRIFKERINFQPHCIDFVEKFRLSSDQVEDLLEIIGPALTHATVRQGSLTLVRWPECNQKRAQIAQDFYRVGGMPCVAGCVDVTLIKIRAPVTDEDQFVDRHGNHSINFMWLALSFRHLVSARWPGRLNDKRVLNNSTMSDAFEGGWRPFPNALILGDSGYSLKQWLITPIVESV
uniref:DDE Tnp4 domain-containing protein n=1 Tax=Macrostomum lignano TaxID=282301 RepID=A0A1I8FXR4_9PLAT